MPQQSLRLFEPPYLVFFAPPIIFSLTLPLVVLFVMQIEHLRIPIFLSLVVISSFDVPSFSPLNLSFIALFLLLHHKPNRGQLVLLRAKITADHHPLQLVNLTFYSYFAFFSRLSKFLLAFYFQTPNSGLGPLTVHSFLVLSECSYLVYLNNLL